MEGKGNRIGYYKFKIFIVELTYVMTAVMSDKVYCFCTSPESITSSVPVTVLSI